MEKAQSRVKSVNRCLLVLTADKVLLLTAGKVLVLTAEKVLVLTAGKILVLTAEKGSIPGTVFQGFLF